MSTGNDRDRESSCYSDSSLESDQFQCDLTLIMIHGNNAVELFLNQRFVEYNVRRERTHCIDALFLSPLNSRFDYINLLTSAVSVLAAVRVQSCNTDSRILDAGAGKSSVGKTDCSLNTKSVVLTQIVAYLRDRNMAGSSCGVQSVSYIDLTERLCMSKKLCQIVMLTLKSQSCFMHSCFIQRSEYISADFSCLPQFYAKFQHIQASFSALYRLGCKRNFLRIQVFLIQYRKSFAPVSLIHIRDNLYFYFILCADYFQCTFEHTQVSDNYRSAVLLIEICSCAFCHKLRSYACSVSQKYANYWFCCHNY